MAVQFLPFHQSWYIFRLPKQLLGLTLKTLVFILCPPKVADIFPSLMQSASARLPPC